MRKGRLRARRTPRRYVLGRMTLLAGLLGALIAVSAPGAPEAAAAVPPANIYVVSSLGSALSPVPLGGSTPGPSLAVGRTPHFVALSPDGAAAFATNFGDGTVTPVDLAVGTQGPPTAVGSKPEGIAVTPDGSKAYVAISGDNRVVPLTLNGSTAVAGTAIIAGLNPYGIAITPNGASAYVSNSGSGTVTPIDLASATPGAPIPVGLSPQGIAVAPNGATVYVVNAGSGSVTPISTSNNVPGAPIATSNSGAPAGSPSSSPSQIAITPDGLTAYVTNPGTGSLGVLDLASTPARLRAEIALPAAYPPSGVAVAPNGATVYVTSSFGNALLPVSTSTNALGTPITGIAGALGVAITPDQAPVAQLTASARTVPAGTTVTLDASASTTAYGTIVAYQFFFGDGSDPIVSSSPIVTHLYKNPGMFEAKVYELNSNGTSYFSVYTGQTMSRNVPVRNGLPQDAASLSITVTGAPLPVRTPIMVVANLAGGNLTPVAVPIGSAPPTVSSSVPGGKGPAFSAFAPDASAAVVTNFLGNTLTPYSLCTGGAGGPSLVPGTAVATGASPSQVAISPVPVSRAGTQAQWHVYVVDFGANDVRRYLLTVDTALCTATLAPPTSLPASVIAVGTAPYGIAISPDGQTAYVSNSGSGTVTPIDLATAAAGTPIPVGLRPRGLAVSPNGATVYVVNADSSSVTPISTATKVPGAPIPVGANPSLIAITPDGASAYVGDGGPPSAVTPIDLTTNRARPDVILPTGTSPTGVAVTPDGTRVFVASYPTGTVHAIDVATDKLAGDPIVGFAGPVGLTITPDQAPAARITASATTVPAGTAVTFDASSSTVTFGTIKAYQFNFGDGTPAVVTSSPVVTHSFANAGTYPVVVYELSEAGTGYTSSFTGQTYSRYAPTKPDGVPQDAAGIYVTVTAGAGGAIPRNTPVLYVSNLGGAKLTPVALPAAAPPVVGAPIPTGNGPAFSAATPDRRALVVSNFYDNTVTPIAVCPAGANVQYTRGTAVATGQSPSQVAVSPTPAAGSTAAQPKWDVYVADSGADDVRHFVLSLDTLTCTASVAPSQPLSASIIPVGASPYGIAITPDGAKAYVSNTGSGTVTPIDLATGQPGIPIPVGQRPQGIAVTPDGTKVYVANSASNTVTPITVATNTPGTPISVGSNPIVVAITPGSRVAFVTNNASATVSQIDLTTNRVIRTITIPGGQPAAVAVTPDGATAWVSSYNTGTLIPIDVATGAIGPNTLSGLQQPVGVSVSITP